MTDYTHLVISGGGCYGLCLLGVFRYLFIEKKLNNIKYIAGNSCGAFFSLAYCLKIEIDILENIIKDLIKENNLRIDKNNIGNLFIDNGIIDMSIFTNKLKDYLNNKYHLEDITFLELSKKFALNLYISATNVNTTKNTIFSTDNTPNVSVFDATCASMTIPYACIPIKINEEYYIDGILTNNFPINIFNNINKESILGIVLNIPDKLDIYNKNEEISFLDYNKRIYEIFYASVREQTFIKYINCDNCNMLLIEDSPISEAIPINIDENKITADFSINDIDNLILDGFIKTSNYFTHIRS